MVTAEQLAALSPLEKQRVLEILRELELTEYQRYVRTTRQRLKDDAERCKATGRPFPDFSYTGELAEAIRSVREKHEKDPTYKSRLQLLEEAPDEVARQERLEREQEEAAMRTFTEAPRIEDARTAGDPGEPPAPGNPPAPVPQVIHVERQAPAPLSESAYGEADGETMKKIMERERLWRENHGTGGEHSWMN